MGGCPLSGEFDVSGAARRVAPFVIRTPLVPAPALSEMVGSSVWLKLESLQNTGSFKVRGAANRILTLPDDIAGVVACSSGNHGRAVAFVAERLEIPATICVPAWVDPIKLEAIRAHGATPVTAGHSYDEAEVRAAVIAEEEGLFFVHPFDDPRVVEGQATLSLEILDELPDMETIVVPLSGGGLAGGLAAGLGRLGSRGKIVAASASSARVMYESLQAERPIEMEEEETLAGALAGGIGLQNRYTFQLVRDLIHEHVLVSEKEISEAVRFAFHELKLVLEGGGAVALAAILQGKISPAGPVVVILSGGNIDPSTLASLVSSH